MSEREYRRDNSRKRDSDEGDIARYERYRYGGDTPATPQYNDIGSTRSIEQLINDPNDVLYETDEEIEEQDELMYNLAGITQYDKAYIAKNDIDVSQLDAANKLAFAAKLSVSFLPATLAKEVLAIFTPATVASMAAIFAVYVAAHATGVGQAMDIGMLIAGGVFFGMDAFDIFKDIAGFANAVNAQNEDDLEIAGQHLASAVAKVGVDAIMTLLTSKVAKKIAGMEEPGTTTGNMDDVNRSIRRHNPQTDRHPYTVEDVGNEIVNNSVATEAYKRITDEGYDVRINHDRPDEPNMAGETMKGEKNVEIYEQNNMSAEDVVGTMVHESVHVQYRNRKRISYNTQYEEYKAAVREEIFRNSKDPTIQTRPTISRRRKIWENVKEDYHFLPQGKNPFGGSVTNE